MMMMMMTMRTTTPPTTRPKTKVTTATWMLSGSPPNMLSGGQTSTGTTRLSMGSGKTLYICKYVQLLENIHEI